MNRRLVQMLPEFRRLCRMSNRERKEFIKSCGKDFIECICECVKNLLKGNAPLKQKQLQCIRRHRQSLRKLALTKTSLASRKRILQSGGFLQYLIGPVVSAVSKLLSNAMGLRSLIMEHANRMVLVDGKLADHFFRKQDQNWKRPTEQLAKHNLSKEMRLGLSDESMPEDIRAKQYQQTLGRFLNMKRKLPDEPLIDFNTTSSVDDLMVLSF
jgi:hypothetical protein